MWVKGTEKHVENQCLLQGGIGLRFRVEMNGNGNEVLLFEN